MAPELLHQDEPTAQSDQFSLAATLYHCLTGHAPRSGERIAEILQSIENDTPIAVRKLNSSLPLEIEIVLEKAMSRNPSHRYPDLRAFANDLDAICKRTPIVAKRLPMPMRLRRWTQRHPVGATVMGFLALFFIAGFWHTQQLLKEKNMRLLQAEREKYLMASRLLVETNPMGAARLAKFALDAEADASARTAILSALVRLHATYTGAGISGKVGPVAYVQPITGKILFLDPDGELCLDEHPQAIEHDFLKLNLPAGDWAGRSDDELGGRLTLSDDSQFIAIAPLVGPVHVMDLASGQWTRLPMSDQAEVSCVDFHANGKLLACGDLNGVLRVFDLQTHQLLFERKAHTGFFGYLEFWEEQQCLVSGSPGGHRLGVPTDQSVQLWDWTAVHSQPSQIMLDGFLSEVAIDRVNQRLYLGDSLGWLSAYSAETRRDSPSWQPSWRIQLPNRIHTLALQSDGSGIACGFGFNPDHETKEQVGIWVLPWKGSAQQRVEPIVGESTICGLSHLPGGEYLASIDWSGIVRIFKRDGTEVWNYPCDTGGAVDLIWCDDLGCMVIPRRVGKPCLVFLPPGFVEGSAVKPVVPRLAATPSVIDPADLTQQALALARESDPSFAPVMEPSGNRHLLVRNESGEFAAVGLDAPRRLVDLPAGIQAPLTCWAGHATSPYFVAGFETHEVIWGDAIAGQCRSVPFAQTELGKGLPQWLRVPHAVAFHPVDPEFTLAVGTSILQTWRITDEAVELVRESRLTDCTCEADQLSYTADGEHMVVCNRSDRNIYFIRRDHTIVDYFQTSEGTTLSSHRIWPDGLTLVGSNTGKIFCFRLADERITPICVFAGHRTRVLGFERSVDGNLITSRSVDGEAYRWPTHPENVYADFVFFPNWPTSASLEDLLGAAGLEPSLSFSELAEQY